MVTDTHNPNVAYARIRIRPPTTIGKVVNRGSRTPVLIIGHVVSVKARTTKAIT